MVPSGILRSIYWWFITDVSGQPNLDCLTLEEGTDRLSRNVGDKVAMHAGLNPRRAIISYVQRRKSEIEIGRPVAFANCTAVTFMKI